MADRGRDEPRATERAPQGMRRFVMHRNHDESGVSGTGLVLEGVLFSTGVVVVHWLTPPPRGSISVFDSLDQFLSIHVRPHPGNESFLVFEDGQRLVALDAELGGDDRVGGGVVAEDLEHGLLDRSVGVQPTEA